MDFEDHFNFLSELNKKEEVESVKCCDLKDKIIKMIMI